MKTLALFTSVILITGSLFSQYPNTLEVEDGPKKQPLNYIPLRTADVMYLKRYQRRISLKEKKNLYLYYPLDASSSRKSLIQIIYNSIDKGELTVFHPFSTGFKDIMSNQEALQVGTSEETIRIENPDGTFVEQKIPEPLDVSKVTSYRIVEEWYINNQSSKLEVQILGICPVLESYDENGEYRGEQPMYWIFFPELRNYLINEPTFNPYNNANSLSYDERLTMRMFSSRIIKEANVYDRTISSYKSGLDALLEGQRIEEELRDYEQDLWNY